MGVSTVCKCLILTDKKMTRQRMTYVLHGEHISLDGRFLAVIVTPNPCPRHVCLMSVTKEIHVNC